MAGQASTIPSGISGAGTATAVISTNTRVRTALGSPGLVTDVVIFTGATGAWFMPNQRVRINNVPTIGKNSVGVYTQGMSTGTMMVVNGDPRLEGM